MPEGGFKAKIFYATFDLFSDIHFDVNVNEQLGKTQPYNFTSKFKLASWFSFVLTKERLKEAWVKFMTDFDSSTG